MSFNIPLKAVIWLRFAIKTVVMT